MSYRITRNAFKADVVGEYSDTDTVIELSSVTGLPDPSSVGNYNVILYDTLFGNPADARNGGSYEIVTVTDITGNDLTVLRGQEDTTAITIGDRPFAVLYGATSKWLEDVLDDIDSKIPIADIVDNLTSTDTDKPLSANQGKELQDNKVDLIESSVTFQVGSGGDYATLNKAIEDVSKNYPIYKSEGVRVTLNMVAGFEMSEQVIVDGIDISWITITGTDSDTTIIRSALTTAIDGRFPAFASTNWGKLPVIGQLFDMDTSGTATNRDGIYCFNGFVTVLAGCGVMNAGDRGLRCQAASYAYARDTNFTDALSQGYECFGGAIINARGGDGSGAGTNGFRVAVGGIIACDGSTGTLSQTANTLTSNGIIFR